MVHNKIVGDVNMNWQLDSVTTERYRFSRQSGPRMSYAKRMFPVLIVDINSITYKDYCAGDGKYCCHDYIPHYTDAFCLHISFTNYNNIDQ